MKFGWLGVGFLLTMTLLCFKALGYISIGWFWVFLPVILVFIPALITWLFVMGAIVVALILALIVEMTN